MFSAAMTQLFSHNYATHNYATHAQFSANTTEEDLNPPKKCDGIAPWLSFTLPIILPKLYKSLFLLCSGLLIALDVKNIT